MNRAIALATLRAATVGALMAAVTAACTGSPAPGAAPAPASPGARSGSPVASAAAASPGPAGSGAGPSTPSAAAPSASAPGQSGLPEPLPTLHPVGSVVVSRSGTGSGPLDLSRLIGTHRTVSLAWVCVGPGDLRVESAGAVIAGSACADTVAQASSFGAAVPLAGLAARRWTVEAGSATRWRLVATVR